MVPMNTPIKHLLIDSSLSNGNAVSGAVSGQHHHYNSTTADTLENVRVRTVQTGDNPRRRVMHKLNVNVLQ